MTPVIKAQYSPTDDRYPVKRNVVHVGDTFSRLIVKSEAGYDKNRRNKMFLCECQCGSLKTVMATHLLSGAIKSCGCLRNEVTSRRNFKHGHSKRDGETKTYQAWLGMIARCKESAKCANNYFHRGIIICERWVISFENFLEDMGEVPEGLTLDRIDNNKGYEPSNCRWATYKEQALNRRCTKWLTVNGETLCLTDVAKKYGISQTKLSERLSYGWTIEKSIQKHDFRSAHHV